MSETVGDNAKEQLRSVIERIEERETKKKEISDDIREIYTEAKSNGYCAKTVRKVVAMRRKDPADRAEEAQLLETYLHALGMEQ